MFQYFLKTCNTHTEDGMSTLRQDNLGAALIKQAWSKLQKRAGTGGVLARLSDMKPITGPAFNHRSRSA